MGKEKENPSLQDFSLREIKSGLKTRSEFNPDDIMEDTDILFPDFMVKWLRDEANKLAPRLYANYAYALKSSIVPYFEKHPVGLLKLTVRELENIYVNSIGELVKPNFLTQHFEIVLKNNGLKKIRFHDLRHSCASLLYANGVSLKEIQEWLGHSDIGTTSNIYTHLDYSSKVSSANAILAFYPASANTITAGH